MRRGGAGTRTRHARRLTRTHACLSPARAVLLSSDAAALVSQLHELKSRAGRGNGVLQRGDIWASAPQDATAAASHLPRNTDRAELTTSSAFQVIGLYSIMVACLLTVFIQQECGVTECVTSTDPLTSASLRTCTTAHAPCSFSQNLRVGTRFGRAVVAFNFTTLAVFLISNALFWFREKWIITHFDTDTDLPIDNLTDGAQPAALLRCCGCAHAAQRADARVAPRAAPRHAPQR